MDLVVVIQEATLSFEDLLARGTPFMLRPRVLDEILFVRENSVRLRIVTITAAEFTSCILTAVQNVRYS